MSIEKKKKRKPSESSFVWVFNSMPDARHSAPLPQPHPAPEELIYLPAVFVLRLLITTVGVYFDTLSAATTGPSTASDNWRARREEKRLNGKKKEKGGVATVILPAPSYSPPPASASSASERCQQTFSDRNIMLYQGS